MARPDPSDRENHERMRQDLFGTLCFHIWLEAIASRLEAIALRLEAIARPSLLGWWPLLVGWRALCVVIVPPATLVASRGLNSEWLAGPWSFGGLVSGWTRSL